MGAAGIVHPMVTAITSPLVLRRWKRVEYERLVEMGVFEDERLELLDGLLVVREPQGVRHAAATRLVLAALRRAFGEGWLVEAQFPIALDDDSEPEPDVFVVPGGPRDYLDAHPSRPVLIVEVAESSLRKDRAHKASLYARAGIADFWIVNLVDRVLEVHRDPQPSAAAPYGWSYRTVAILRDPETVSPLAAPAARIAVAELLP
jgi:Uma2 family endonuclease